MTAITLPTRHFEVVSQHVELCIDTAVPPTLVTPRLTELPSCFVVPRPAEESFPTSPEQNTSPPISRPPPPSAPPRFKGEESVLGRQPSAHKREPAFRQTAWPLRSLSPAGHSEPSGPQRLHPCQYPEVFPRQRGSHDALIPRATAKACARRTLNPEFCSSCHLQKCFYSVTVIQVYGHDFW